MNNDNVAVYNCVTGTGSSSEGRKAVPQAPGQCADVVQGRVTELEGKTIEDAMDAEWASEKASDEGDGKGTGGERVCDRPSTDRECGDGEASQEREVDRWFHTRRER